MEHQRLQTRRGSKLAESKAARDGAIFWWDGTMPTRVNDPKTAVKIIVIQRLHEDDLTDAFVYAVKWFLGKNIEQKVSRFSRYGGMV